VFKCICVLARTDELLGGAGRTVTPYNGARNFLLSRGIYFLSLEIFLVIFGENKFLSEFDMPLFPS
jgi:hypothetical protein